MFTVAPYNRAVPIAVRSAAGFTMLELMVAITIVGLVLSVAVPASGRLYRTMQYRDAVRDVVTLFASARYEAVNSGRAQDVRINPRTRELSLNTEIRRLPEGLNLVVRAARELNDQRSGVIRFYPEGGTSGGGVDVEIPGSYGVRVNVDWLVGRVSQQKYALD